MPFDYYEQKIKGVMAWHQQWGTGQYERTPLQQWYDEQARQTCIAKARDIALAYLQSLPTDHCDCLQVTPKMYEAIRLCMTLGEPMVWNGLRIVCVEDPNAHKPAESQDFVTLIYKGGPYNSYYTSGRAGTGGYGWNIRSDTGTATTRIL